ncbi:MAG: ubiquinol-cytochrome c reductase iron-sulfur subunit [Chloroflexi bacterium]|nr:ubiquinol-cytochrome c reductase iron-sulfur subunit [Chloroflexota bacterium]
MASSNRVSRRDFVKVTTAVLSTIMGAVVGLPVIGYLIDPALKAQKSDTWIPLGPLENYPIGKPTLFTFTRSKVNGWEKTVNSYGVFVLQKSKNEVTVLSNVCTHLSCRVNWHEDVQEYICPCHDAQFDADGKVLGGPPPRPLDKYEIKVEDGDLFIHFVEG